MSHRRWLSPTESLLVISVEEDTFLTAHGIDQHEVFDGSGRSAHACAQVMLNPVNAHYRVAIGVEPCAAGHAMRDREGRCVICEPSVLDAVSDVARDLTHIRLTAEESAFLTQHGIKRDTLYDAAGSPRRVYGPIMKAMAYSAAVNVTRCLRGHALRDRKGTCLICHPASMNFLQRHNSPGWVYLAYSGSGRFYKVGSSNNLEDRLEQLNIHRYGGRGDWEIIEQRWCEEAGRSEHAVQTLLAEHGVDGDYGGRPEYCRELFRCNRKVALAAMTGGVAS